MSASPNLQLPYLDANQNQKSVTHNAALRRLDALVQIGVGSSALQAPPSAPTDGQRWIVAPGGTGAWAGRDLAIAAWQDGAWSFYPPGPGTLAFDAARGAVMFWTGTAWRAVAGAGLDPVAAAGLPPALDYRLTAPDGLPPGQFSRPSTGYRTDAAGLLVPVAAGGLRIDHDPLTGAPLGALIEEQRTNLLPYTMDIGAGVWGCGANASFQGTVPAPDGTSTARIVRMTSTGNAYASTSTTLVAGTTYTFSGWFKLVAGSPSNGGLLLATWSGGSAEVPSSQLSAAWERFSLTFTPSTGGTYGIYAMHDMAPSGTVDVAVWGLQLEVGSFPTSYIPTTAAQATRAADSLAVPATPDWFNPSEWTLYVEAQLPGVVPSGWFPSLFEVCDGTLANRYVCYVSGQEIYFADFVNSALKAGQSTADAPLGQSVKVAVSVGSQGKALSVAGSTASWLPVTLLSGLNLMTIGASFAAANVSNTQILRVACFSRALAPAQLQALTS